MRLLDKARRVALGDKVRYPGQQTKEVPFVWPTWRSGTPEWHITDLKSYIDEGFNLNTLIYSAIMYKVRAMMQAPLKAFEGSKKRPVLVERDSRLAELITRPNPHQSFVEFQSQNIVYLNLSGNCYILMDRDEEGLPQGMYSLRPDRTYVVPSESKHSILGYLYVPEGKGVRDGKPLLAEDVMHIKYPNPGDPLEGMGQGLSPISPLAQSADIDNSVTDFLKLFFEKGVMIPGLLSFPEPLDETTAARTRERWKEIYGGYSNWAEEIGMVGRGAEYQRIGLTFDQMGFGEIDERTESRILGPFGVPPILIGTRVGLERASYSNYSQARKACWEDTLVPELKLFEVEYQYNLRQDETWVAFDTSKVPALQKDVPALVNAAHKMWQMGVPANQAFYSVGLDVEPIPGGDQGYLPLSIVPSGGEYQPGGQSVGEPPVKPTGEEEEGKSQISYDKLAEQVVEKLREEEPPKKVEGPIMGQEAKYRFWKQTDRTAESWEPKFRQIAYNQLKKQKRQVLTIIHEHKRKSIENKVSVTFGEVEESITEYMGDQAQEDWRGAFTPAIRGVVSDQGENLANQFGMQFDIRNILAEQAFERYMIPFAEQPVGTTEESVRRLLQQGMNEGWGIDKLSNKTEQLFGFWLDEIPADDVGWFEERLVPNRLETIARTETMRASNWGTTQIYEKWGTAGKEWLATMDGRVRPAHADANGQKRPHEEPFDVGGEKLDFPGDPAGSASNVCNCRCTTIPVMDPEELPSEHKPSAASFEDRQWRDARMGVGGPDTDIKGKRYLLDGLMDPEDLEKWYRISNEVRADAKDRLVSKLARRTGYDYDDVNMFIRQWSMTSNDKDMRSLAIQQDVADLFDTPLSDFTRGRIEEMEKQFEEALAYQASHYGRSRSEAIDWLRETKPRYFSLFESDKQKDILREMYNLTQERFAQIGFEPGDTIKLRRGVTLPERIVSQWKPEDVSEYTSIDEWLKHQKVEVEGNPVESWALDEFTADHFAQSGIRPDMVGITFEADIPVERILGSSRTGFGCLRESEMVVLGGSRADVARTRAVYIH